MKATNLVFLTALVALVGCSETTGPVSEDSTVREPIEVDGAFAFDVVGAGFNHSCAVTTDGELLCWGMDELGQLGFDVITHCNLGFSGSYACSGTPGAVPVGVRMVSVDGSDLHTCALDVDGAAWCWGGPLGAPAMVSTDLRFDALVVGSAGLETCGRTGGEVYCWAGVVSPDNPPTRVAESLDVADVGVGHEHACVLSTDGQVYCWGRNDYSQLGLGRNSVPEITDPHIVATDSVFVALAVGHSYSCALTAAGAPYCWGDMRTLDGIGSFLGSQPTKVDGAPPLQSLYAGGLFACGLDADGAAWCWGDNHGGELGDGTVTSSAEAVMVQGGLHFDRLALGGGHACGLTADGRLYCWGDNVVGQVGRPSPYES